MKIGSWIARSVIERVSTRSTGVPHYRRVVVSLTLGNLRTMVLLFYAAVSARNGSTSLATTWRIAKPDAPSATGTRKSSSAAPARAARSRMAGRSRTGRPTTRDERLVLSTTNHLAMLDKPFTAKITLPIIPSPHTHNTRLSHSRIISRSTADLAPRIHRCTLRQCLKDRPHSRNHTTPPPTACLPSCRNTRLPRQVLRRVR